MNEKPILFSGPMVRAILENRKTMTRRIMKLGPAWYDDDGKLRNTQYWEGRELINMIPCPYGFRGTRLWVRETWQKYQGTDYVHYRANSEQALMVWRPSIHMPRWASRLTLEITGVKAERVQDISEDDARAEGIPMIDGYFPDYSVPGIRWDTARASFIALWDSINAKRPGCSWQDNPWVWCISFKRVTI